MGKWYKDGEPYRPSTGTEGMDFECKFCNNCMHQNPDPNSKRHCDILMRAFWYNIGEEKYPREWQYKNDQGTCTAFTKWDWGNDGDPDDPDNPRAPIPPDPNQLNLFPLYPDDRVYSDNQKELIAK
jgi:hypothetical protein